MSTSLLSLVIKHERRIRLVFDAPLAIAAFGTSAAVLARFTVTCTNALGVSPTVSAAIMVANAPANLELSLGMDLVDGAIYTVAVAGVPAADASSVSGALQFSRSDRILRPDREVTDDHDIVLYGSDLFHNGTDYVEGADGDLAVVEGLPCVQAHLTNGVFANGFLWAPSYGGKLRKYVDATQSSLPGAKQAIDRFFNADDRVKKVVTTFVPSSTPFQGQFASDVTLIGGDTLDPLTTNTQDS